MALIVAVALVVSGLPALASDNSGYATRGFERVDGDYVLMMVEEADQGAIDLNADGDTTDFVVHMWNRKTDTVVNLGVAVEGFVQDYQHLINDWNIAFEEGIAAFLVPEGRQGNTDLNGDGDSSDNVLHVWQPGDPSATNLGVAISDSPGGQPITISSGTVVFGVEESAQGNTDLNGDGVVADSVIHVWRPGSGLENLNLRSHYGQNFPVRAEGSMFIIPGHETSGINDFNGDGDYNDEILFAWDSSTDTLVDSDLSTQNTGAYHIDSGQVMLMAYEADDGPGGTDYNGDGNFNDFVAHLWDPTTGTTVNGLVGGASEQPAWGGALGDGSFLLAVRESVNGPAGTDYNGDGDTTDDVAFVWANGAGSPSNLGVATSLTQDSSLGDGAAAFIVPENGQGGSDLNGDGDTIDGVLHVWSASSGLQNVGLHAVSTWTASISQGVVGFLVREAEQGNTDRNGDGDASDHVVTAYTVATDTVHNLALAAPGGTTPIEADAGKLVFPVSESAHGGTDINGDGFNLGIVVHKWDSGSTTFLPDSGVAFSGTDSGSILYEDPAAYFQINENSALVDLNGDGDQFDGVLHVDSPNQPPTADADGPYQVDEGSTVQLDGSGSSDPDGTIDVYDWSPATNLDDPSLVDPTFSGVDDAVVDMTLTVTDNDGESDSDTTTVTVNNLAPTVVAGVDQTVTVGDTVNLDPATFTDPGSVDTHTAQIDWGDGTVEAGTVDQTAGSVSGSHTYTTDGVFTVTVTVTDDDTGTHSDTLTITVDPTPNVAPTAEDDQTVTREGTSVSIDVLANDSDPDGDTMTVTDLSDPANGSVAINPDETVEYTPGPGFVGTDTFTYTANDGQSESAPATVTVFVTPPNKLLASDGATVDRFGFSVAVSSDRIVVGAHLDDDNGTDSGSVYVFEPDGAGGWTETKLTASDGAAVDQFGWSVAVSGDRIVVGAIQDDDLGDDSGSVYVFEPDGAGGWTETKLTASDGAAVDRFGISAAVSGDRIVVGAYLDDDLGASSGSVYVYEPDGTGGWTETKLTASDGAPGGDEFGISVAVSGDRIVVGAHLDDDNGGSSGAVYVYEPDGAGGWTETKLTASDGAAVDRFGWSVAVSGDRIVVGAHLDDDLGDISGSVYVFEPDGAGGWTETKLLTSDGAAADVFGWSVAVSGDRIVVGAIQDDDLGDDSGSAYVFEPDGAGGWAETKLTASDGAPAERFGWSVAMSGDRIVVGADGDDDNGTNSGSAYVFDLGSLPNQPPTADADGPYQVDEGSTVQLDGSGSSDPDGTIDVYDWSPATNLDDPSLVDPTFTGVDDAVVDMTLTVTDNDGESDSDTTTVTVNNVAPTVEAGVDQTVTVGDTVNLDPATFTDPGTADTHTAEIDWGDGTVEAGTVDQTAGTVSGSHSYTTDGVFTVTVTVTDDDTGTHADTLQLVVEAVNAAPVAADDQTVTRQDTPVSIDVLANDTDPDGDALTVANLSDPANGTVSINPDETVEYTPDPGFVGTDTFTYTANDGLTDSDPASVTVFIIPPNKLLGSDGAEFDQFGQSVAVSGDRVVVGAYLDDDNGNDSGSVYVYEPDGTGGWTETKLTASDGAAGDQFGVSVAVSGNRIVVGALWDDDNGEDSGSVYVYEPDGAGGWTETKLTASDGAAFDQFGWAVALSGNRIVVGARGDDDGAFGAGSVYVYEPDGAGGWTETKLTASDGALNDAFGSSVAVSADRIVVGAGLADGNALVSGSVYVYEPDAAGGWTETKLIASDGASNDVFGFSVTVSAERVVVGTPADDDNSGSVYVYEPDGTGGWTETKLTASDGAAFDQFGWAVGVSGDRIVVGAQQDDDNGFNSGSVYLFGPDGAGGWAEIKLTAADGASGDLFGLSVALSGDRVIVGAPFDRDSGPVSGSAYVFELAPLPENDPPTANDDTADTVVGIAVDIDVLSNDTDPDGDPLSVTNLTDPANGSVALNTDGTVQYTPDAEFSGIDTFTYTAFDGQAESDSATVTVTVEDVTPPVLSLPADMTVEATGPDGATVEYIVTATDDSDPVPNVTCVPASGSLFPVGETLVSCTATDASGNSSDGTFLVTVEVGDATFDGFVTAVEDLDLRMGTERGIVSKIEEAQAFFISEDTEGAISKLMDVINFVEAQEGKKLTPAEADQIRVWTQTLIDALTA